MGYFSRDGLCSALTEIRILAVEAYDARGSKYASDLGLDDASCASSSADFGMVWECEEALGWAEDPRITVGRELFSEYLEGRHRLLVRQYHKATNRVKIYNPAIGESQLDQSNLRAGLLFGKLRMVELLMNKSKDPQFGRTEDKGGG